MELKAYQKKVIADLNRYLQLLNETRDYAAAFRFFWQEKSAPSLGQYQDSADQIPDGTPVEIQENEEGNPEFTAQPGCVYLVQGQWENGTADYGFWTPSE